MSCGQRVIVALAVLLALALLCGGSGFLAYTYGYKVGQLDSYKEGFKRGKESGYELGYDAGYRASQAQYELERQRDNERAVVLRNPTYQEMKKFLEEDPTNSKSYVENQYVCVDFAIAVNNNAEERGIRCAIVNIFHPEGYGHTIVAFETTDRGLIFVEPQFDCEVKLVVGKSYSQINGFTPPPRDDTIIRYLIDW